MVWGKFSGAFPGFIAPYFPPTLLLFSLLVYLAWLSSIILGWEEGWMGRDWAEGHLRSMQASLLVSQYPLEFPGILGSWPSTQGGPRWEPAIHQENSSWWDGGTAPLATEVRASQHFASFPQSLLPRQALSWKPELSRVIFCRGSTLMVAHGCQLLICF